MLQYTILILDEKTRQPIHSVIIPEDKLLQEVWSSIIKSISKDYNVSLDCIEFGHDYYSKLKLNLEAELRKIENLQRKGESFETSLDLDFDDVNSDGLLELIYSCEQELMYELPNPLDRP
jgi:hypothetical protein